MLFVASMIATHLSRLAEDLIIFSSDEFGFVELPEAYTTGSSLMPQKRNPDGLELARGMAARSIGELTAALAMLKGTPSGYNKDFQEDKRLLFGAVDAARRAAARNARDDCRHAVPRRARGRARGRSPAGDGPGRRARPARRAVPRGARRGRPPAARGG
jgi:hypothetical protein